MLYKTQSNINHHFTYRALMFLSLGIVLARSFNTKKIYQFENGILANAIPPSPSFSMTKHAHPLMHKYYLEFIQSLFNEDKFIITNPFLLNTKREIAEQARKHFKGDFDLILEKTETCWYYYSNFNLTGKSKEPNRACGICIPCLIRRTADLNYNFQFDISSKEILKDPHAAFTFKSYESFAKKVLSCKNNMQFYMNILDGSSREALQLSDNLDLEDLFLLYKRFSKEFKNVFSP